MWPLGQGNGRDSLPPIAALGATEPISQKVNEFQTTTTAANDPNADSVFTADDDFGVA
jgi:hypothetical protein